jgi:hypothetical protein
MMGAVMQPLFWDKSLTYEIQPKSGPIRRMVTLADVRTAMVYDLPPGTTKQPHWLNAGMLVVAASESGRQGDIHVATDAITDALDVEGWLSAAAVTA